MKKWILVMDSGIGGLWTLKELKREMPTENFLYFMDKLHSPYGNKHKKTLQKIVCQNVKKIREKFFVKAIVLACNTASSVCCDILNQQNCDIKIFTIQPKIDFEKIRHEKTLVLATKNTAKYSKVIKEAKKYESIHIYAFKHLARQIENANGNFDLLLTKLKKELKKFENFGIKNIVLGCTHYNYVKEQLKQIFGDVNFFENSKNVAKQCKNMLKNRQKTQKNNKKLTGSTIIFCKI